MLGTGHTVDKFSFRRHKIVCSEERVDKKYDLFDKLETSSIGVFKRYNKDGPIH